MANALQSLEGIAIQGPAPALVARVRNQYIYEVGIKCPRDTRVQNQVKAFLKEQKQKINLAKGFSGVHILFDVDPVG
jgi:primosomal protein N' (replication factor Y)